MRFVTSHMNLKYTVIASEYQESHGRRNVTKPLRAIFESGVFDSVAAQKVYRWSDEERETVENYLQEHVDFGRHSGIFREDDPLVPEHRLPLAPGADDQGCAFTFRLKGNSERCGKAVIEDSAYCKEHAALLTKVG